MSEHELNSILLEFVDRPLPQREKLSFQIAAWHGFGYDFLSRFSPITSIR